MFALWKVQIATIGAVRGLENATISALEGVAVNAPVSVRLRTSQPMPQGAPLQGRGPVEMRGLPVQMWTIGTECRSASAVDPELGLLSFIRHPGSRYQSRKMNKM